MAIGGYGDPVPGGAAARRVLSAIGLRCLAVRGRILACIAQRVSTASTCGVGPALVWPMLSSSVIRRALSVLRGQMAAVQPYRLSRREISWKCGLTRWTNCFGTDVDAVAVGPGGVGKTRQVLRYVPGFHLEAGVVAKFPSRSGARKPRPRPFVLTRC